MGNLPQIDRRSSIKYAKAIGGRFEAAEEAIVAGANPNDPSGVELFHEYVNSLSESDAKAFKERARKIRNSGEG